jgi:acyl-coenzyme A synthetase/AMP-(fatty) acid ligase
MAAKPDSPFSGVRLYISTYDAIHPPAVRAFLAASTRPRAAFMHGWGQSETGPLTLRFFTRRALAARGHRHPTTRSQGLPTPGKTRLRVVDPKTFRAVPRGQPGVILARTKARCLGYLGEQERWDEKVDGPWFNTGDIGIVTWSGNVVFLDREVDEIPGMSCVEIEDVIDDRLPEVLECVVLGTPGRPPLPIVITADGRLDPAAWRDAVRDLPPLDEPMVVTWDQIPRTGTGKVRRLELREQLAGVGITHGTGRWT